MDEQFDKNLTNRVKEVFENYEDSFAHEGWLKLREKFPEKQRRKPLAWWWIGAAAVLLLFFGIGVWVNKQRGAPDTLTIKKTGVIKNGQQGSIQQQGEQNKSTNPGDNEIGNSEKIAGTALQDKQAIPSQNKVFALQKNGFSITAAQQPITGKGFDKNSAVSKHDADNVKDHVVKLQGEQLANVLPKIVPADSAAHTMGQPERSINSMFAHDQQLSKSNNTEKQKNNTKKIRFAVYAATYFNYAKGSDNQLNIGAGFTSDISLAKNLKLVTGISIGQNSLSYTSSSSFNAAVPASASLLAGAAASHYASFNYSIKTASPTLKNYNANLVGLDVPVNIKYSFNSQKSDTYILAGLSSGTFINETYTSQYNYPAQQTQNQVSHNSFNGFYFAKTLNLALGTGFKMGKNQVIVEPFLKYPLDGLGSQQLRFGASGINLKFNFQPTKK